MKPSEMRDLSVDELVAKLADLRGELFNVKIKRETGQLENTARISLLRRDIARGESILSEKRGAGE